MMAATDNKHSDSEDSDDNDVAFASMNFDGVNFDDGEAPAHAPASVSRRDADASCANVAENSMPLHVGINNEHVKECHANEIINRTRNIMDVDIKCKHVGSAVHHSTKNPRHSESPLSSSSQFSSICSAHTRSLSSTKFSPDINIELTDTDKTVLAIEKDRLLPRPSGDVTLLSDPLALNTGDIEVKQLRNLFDQLENGKYADILRSDLSLEIFGHTSEGSSMKGNVTMIDHVKRKVLQQFTKEMPFSRAIIKCITLEVVGIASLNLFLQLNYTGPSMDRGTKPEEEKDTPHPLDGINPHVMIQSFLQKNTEQSTNTSCSVPPPSSSLHSVSEEYVPTHAHTIKDSISSNIFHNDILSELAVDGEWPFQVCVAPYFLLLGRTILSMLAEPTRPFWRWAGDDQATNTSVGLEDLADSFQVSAADGAIFASAAKYLSSATLWNARAVVAHRRLISTRRDDDDGHACPSLWNEAEEMFKRSLTVFCDSHETFDNEIRNVHISSEVMLEHGLAEHHFRKPGRGKVSFNRALEISKLEIEITGAEGKRTKYQQTATAQYLVRATPSSLNTASMDQEGNILSSTVHTDNEKKLMIKHDDVSDDAILLEKIKFEDNEDNKHYTLSILEQSIILALCLDVKNTNPMDGLTGEQMGGYLSRVLNQHDDWMVYATALLERAWLECERTHGRERAILQIQALADQHSNRLTLTQSTFKSVEQDSAPAQDRLRNLHGIVYPPRWDILRDLAEKYSKLGVVTSAAEIFEEIELWDEVVECYRIAGKESKAEEVVRARLAEKATPRMYAALGGLTHDPKCFERSLELSNGKFYDAHVALGKLYFDQGDLRQSLKHFQDGLDIKPLMPAVWFRVGTISMQLGEWDTALRAFTQVVQQEPEEGDAWANVAAIHMRRRNPSEAYPALIESLKQNRNNWRVWVSKLYTCIDLKKFDEAIQTCTELLNLRARRNEIPNPEEKCIRAIVQGCLRDYQDASNCNDSIAMDSSKRTLNRLQDLLEKMKSSMKSEVWLYDVSVCFYDAMGLTDNVFSDLMKEYRALQSVNGWESDQSTISQMTKLVKELFILYKVSGTKENMVKCKLMISGVAKKIRDACRDMAPPREIAELDALLSDLNDLCKEANQTGDNNGIRVGERESV